MPWSSPTAGPISSIPKPSAARSERCSGSPLAQCTTAEAIAWLRAQNLRVVVATPHADETCWEANLARATAIVVGNERYGVSRAWLDTADDAVTVPMPGPADSLNVAVAAGVVLFEAARQRALIASTR